MQLSCVVCGELSRGSLPTGGVLSSVQEMLGFHLAMSWEMGHCAWQQVLDFVHVNVCCIPEQVNGYCDPV